MNTGLTFPSFDEIENLEQKTARYRINSEKTVPVTGPPGTGKSTVISHCCFDLLKDDYFPILVTAPTNVMIDSILSKIDSLLQRMKIQLPNGFVIRYGNVANLNRTYNHLTKYTFDNIVEDYCSSCYSNGYNNFYNKISIAKDFFQNARIILTTDYSAKDLGNIIEVGAVIVDEAGLVGLDRMGMLFSSLRDNNGKIIVIGDDKQLPPVSHDYISESLFNRILGHFPTTLLKREYRFNKDILDLINPYYDFKLEADFSVMNISTADIAKKSYGGINNNLSRILKHEKNVVFVDTNGAYKEERHFTNKGEVAIIKEIANGCLSMGIKDIIVTTPYKQQERLCNFYLQKGVRIGTIDEFQGQEAEVTIISMVRSNNKQNYKEAIGFVNIPRSCVAFSRSKRKTIIVGDGNTLIRNKFLSKSIDTITRKEGFLIWSK
ncbi:MAG TPA: AAA domain-containing protein [Nitrososphaeraceae archaeon]|jgi:superfamily I DNA and/or RNA helicase|nr:AAA domain-containing protein [Nitrososphaeraceae archaeon]